jgi:hypothetical protein
MRIKSHIQLTRSMKTPVINAPIIPPKGGDAAKNPSTTFRDRPGGTMVVMMETALGMKTPPPTPVSARMAMNESYVLVKALINENSVKIAQPRRLSCLWPNMAPRRPVTRTKAPCVSLKGSVS